METKTWILILRWVNIVAAVVIGAMGIYQLVTFQMFSNFHFYEIWSIFTPIYSLIFCGLLLAIEFKKDFIAEQFQFMMTCFGRGIFYILYILLSIHNSRPFNLQNSLYKYIQEYSYITLSEIYDYKIDFNQKQLLIENQPKKFIKNTIQKANLQYNIIQNSLGSVVSYSPTGGSSQQVAGWIWGLTLWLVGIFYVVIHFVGPKSATAGLKDAVSAEYGTA